MIVYGIPNCNTVKKALDWLTHNKSEFVFHDYKKQGITAGKLKEWSKQLGWEALLNKKGTTWRNLLPEVQQKITSEKAAIELMLEKPSVIKRPVIEGGKKLIIGYDKSTYESSF